MTQTITQKVLTEARQLLSDESHWTQLAMARNYNRYSIDPLSPKAVCWCLHGAVQRSTVKLNVTYGRGFEALRLAILDCDYSNILGHSYDSVIDFNDESKRKHSEVLAVLDKAIEIAGKGSFI